MKKYTAFLLAVIMIFSLMAGCGAADDPTTEKDVGTSDETALKIQGTQLTENILRLAYIEYDSQNEYVFDTVVLEERYLVYSWEAVETAKSGLRIFDLYHGTQLWEYDFENAGLRDLAAYGDNSFAAYLYNEEYAYFEHFDDREPEITKLPLEEGQDMKGTETYSYYAPNEYVHTIDGKIYQGNYPENEILVCDLNDYYDSLNFQYEANGSLYFIGYNRFTWEDDFFVVHQDGTFLYIEEWLYEPYYTTDNKVYTSDMDDGKVKVRLKNNLYYELDIYCETKTENLICANDTSFASYDYYGNEDGELWFRVYSASDASLLYKTDMFSDAGYLMSGDFIDEDTLYLMFSKLETENGKDEEQTYFYVVDLKGSAPIERERQMGTKLDVPFELEAQLEREYGVEIYTGKDAIIAFPDFYAEELSDVDLVTGTLESVKWVMDKFPAGFFRELCSEANEYGPRKLHIHIASTLTPSGSSGTSFPAAYAYYDYETDAQVIVLDGTQTYSLKTNFAHELMHAIENYINSESSIGFARWEDYLPEYFEYNYGYRGTDGMDYSDSAFTAYFEESPMHVYFLDTYSKTFPTEDKARIFENLFMAETEQSDVLIYENIRERAIYLCEVIRANFASVRNSDEIWWERFLY